MRRFDPLPALAVAGTLFLTSACASPSGKYPSLAIRDVERVEGSFDVDEGQEPRAPAIPATNPDLVARLAGLVEQAQTAHAEFTSEVPSATRLAMAAGNGTDPSSNAWQSAQVALASLESRRSSAAIPLGDLDLLYADAAIALEQRGAIDAARSQVVALIEEEDATLQRLRGNLPQ